MKKVVVGYDGSSEGKDALAFAGVICQATDAELYVACITEHEPLFKDFVKAEEEKNTEIKRLLEEAARELSYSPFHEYTATGSAAEGIAATVHGVGADLVVIGSSHQGRLGRIHPGSVGERLLHGTRCAVAVAPRGYARRPRDARSIIGVAFDGRTESKEALAFAVELAKAMRASLRLVAVVPNVFKPGQVGYDAALQRDLRDDLSRKLQAAEDDLPAELDVVTTIDEGDPVDVLTDRSADVDLIVVGSRAYGPVGYALLGGVSYPLMRTSESPVVVVPKGAAADASAEAELATA